MDLGLEGKTALVTGGSHGIGLAIAAALAQEGCYIYSASRGRRPTGDMVRAFSTLPNKVTLFQFDALDQASVEHLAQEILEVGGVDILINNVGGGGRWGTTPLETPLETWDQVYQKNAGAAIQLTRALVPTMLWRR
jgi:NAD(P)-dependent dehydrogenase (short-subunit alcohol dehydrogenase family)